MLPFRDRSHSTSARAAMWYQPHLIPVITIDTTRCRRYRRRRSHGAIRLRLSPYDPPVRTYIVPAMRLSACARTTSVIISVLVVPSPHHL